MKIKALRLETTKDSGFGKKPYKIKNNNELARPLTVKARVSIPSNNLRTSKDFILDSGLAFPALISNTTYKELGEPQLSEAKKGNLVNGETIELKSFKAMVTIGEISFDTTIYLNPNKSFEIDLIGSPIFNLFAIYIGRNSNTIMPRMDKLIESSD